MLNKYEQLKDNFLSGNIDGCRTFFEKNDYLLEAAYCNIIEDDLNKARYLFEKNKDIDPRACWGIFLTEVLNQDVKKNPTYFEIRNFLEIDMNILIQYYKGEYVENIIRYSDYMWYFNPECYKFIGRVFWANNMMPAAMFFLNRAKDKFYNDPELHHLLAYIYYNEGKIQQCEKAIDACLSILPEYAPTLKLKEKLNG